MNPALAAVLAEIDAVDWSAHTGRRRVCDTGGELRRLAGARLLNEAASAGTRLLEDSALVDDFELTLGPACVPAVPILLGIAEHGSSPAAAAALGVLDGILDRSPEPGAERTAGGVLQCCAVADLVRAHPLKPGGPARRDRELRAALDRHWRFEVLRVLDAGAGWSIAHGLLTGRLTGPPAHVDPYGDEPGTLTVEPGWTAHTGEGEAVLRVTGTSVGAGRVLRPARCVDW